MALDPSSHVTIAIMSTPVEKGAASVVKVAEEVAREVDSDLGSQGRPAESSDRPIQAIDFSTALQCAAGNNPSIALAQARVAESLAQLERSQSLKLPSIRAGINYNKHEGRIQDVAGTVIETSRGSFYHGLGANAVGAGSPIVPGVVSQFHWADAVFQPRIAQQTYLARRASSETACHEAMLSAALAYNELLRAEQERSVMREALQQAQELERVTAEFERVGEGLASDHDRARTEMTLCESEALRVDESVAIASARLAELIRWDQASQLRAAQTQLVAIRMQDPQSGLGDLLATALSERPELRESRHLVQEAIQRLQREKHAPLVPSMLLAASYGGLGGGLGSDLTNYGDRFDADAVLYWELRQLGVGERTARQESQARIQQARQRQLAQMDRIARDVAQAHAQVVARTRQVDVLEKAVRAAEDSYQRNWNRIRNGQGLPIEVLQAMQALVHARREYIRVLADHNQAQFLLQRALGWPIPMADWAMPTGS
jgi:outer membrane protein TolC